MRSVLQKTQLGDQRGCAGPDMHAPPIRQKLLRGRIGNGEPFSIGDTTNAFDMPASGRLFLGVNDDHYPDNSGNYVVKVWEP